MHCLDQEYLRYLRHLEARELRVPLLVDAEIPVAGCWLLVVVFVVVFVVAHCGSRMVSMSLKLIRQLTIDN